MRAIEKKYLFDTCYLSGIVLENATVNQTGKSPLLRVAYTLVGK